MQQSKSILRCKTYIIIYMDVRSTFTKLIPLYNITNICILSIQYILVQASYCLQLTFHFKMICYYIVKQFIMVSQNNIQMSCNWMSSLIWSFTSIFSSVAGDRCSKKYFVCRRQRCKELSINFKALLFLKVSKHSTTIDY